jgi:drug/metabolite transporter (DMT)-like permease
VSDLDPIPVSGAPAKVPDLWATAPLLAVTVVWGSTFVIVQDVVRTVPVLDFLGLRFGIATVLMLLIRPQRVRALPRGQIKRGVVLGLVLGGGYVLQTLGLQHASATVAGFITGLFVVFTPIVAWVFLRSRIERAAWLGVILATFGLALLSLNGWSVGIGELLTLGCALLYAVHIVGLGQWSTHEDAYGLAVIQLGTVSIVCTTLGATNGFVLPSTTSTWAAVVFLAVFATAIAFFVQTWAQAHLSPTRTAVVMTMEPVFATLFAVLFADEQLTTRIVVGAACVLAAMYLVELGPRHAADAEIERLEV